MIWAPKNSFGNLESISVCFTFSDEVMWMKPKQFVLLQALHLCFGILYQIFQNIQFIKFYRFKISFEGNIAVPFFIKLNPLASKPQTIHFYDPRNMV